MWIADSLSRSFHPPTMWCFFFLFFFFFQTIMEQFNPCLRNFVAMGKNYEKALANVTFAAKGYFDALVRMGELASESQGSKDLGDVLFQMAEVHRQIQVQLEEMVGISSNCVF
uniref:IMD domain-containing protein n=1 Tax=Xiphophorus couchianus TaxID=32473 RepID=A0A3B5LT07_9TELE